MNTIRGELLKSSAELMFLVSKLDNGKQVFVGLIRPLLAALLADRTIQ